MYARLAAEDLLTFNQIANSTIIKKGLIAMGYKPFDSHTAVSKAVSRYAQRIKHDIMKLLKELLAKEERFSITLDEWTGKSNRRFSDFNVHFPRMEPKCIGMKRIHGSLDAVAAAEMTKQKLMEYGLNIETDIVANTTDGASVMVSMGEKLPTLHVLCMSHGIHLAVVAVLYTVSELLYIDRAETCFNSAYFCN